MRKSQFLLTSLVGAIPCGALFGLLVWMWMSKMATFGDMPTMFHVFSGVTAFACAVGAFVIPIGILLQKAPEYAAAPVGAVPEEMAYEDDDADESDAYEDDDEYESDEYEDSDVYSSDSVESSDAFAGDEFADEFDDFEDDDF